MFRIDLLKELLPKNVQISHLDSPKAAVQYVFDRHALFKEKHVRCNQAPFANKSIYMYVCTYLFAINKKNHYNAFQ